MKSSRPKTKSKAAADAHAFYDAEINTMFRKLGKLRGRKAEALAMLLYSAWASTFGEWTGFEREHDPVNIYEAETCRTLADGILAVERKEILDPETIKEMFQDKLIR